MLEKPCVASPGGGKHAPRTLLSPSAKSAWVCQTNRRPARGMAWIAVSLMLIAPALQARNHRPPTQLWQSLLQRHVHVIDGGHASRVDYAAMERDKALLDRYVKALGGITRMQYDRWSKHQQMAFLINLYNAQTVELILSRWPRLSSIRDLGSWWESPWRKRFFDVLGKPHSLDDIETMLRSHSRFGDPRVHFAINCASVGCPMLQPYAYTGARLDAQLQIAARDFLSDRSRNRYDAAAQTLEVSRLFDWYVGDFEASRFHSVRGFLAAHSDALTEDPKARQRIRAQHAPLSFLPYDWSLNSVRPSTHWQAHP